MAVNPKNAPAAEEDDDMDLFGSDEEEEDPEVVAERERRLAEYKKKKEGKAKPAAKSVVTMDVKPWDDETDMDELKANVIAIEMDGLVWGRSQLIAVGFGIKKLQINLVVEDEKVSLEELQQKIEEDEDHVQSTDIVSLSAPNDSSPNLLTNRTFFHRLLCKSCRPNFKSLQLQIDPKGNPPFFSEMSRQRQFEMRTKS